MDAKRKVKCINVICCCVFSAVYFVLFYFKYIEVKSWDFGLWKIKKVTFKI